jgi:hypothetical protein|tara:strand:- start:442 stop:615 length:174 start_codon:yes stop_codon:yes gene_type:complete
MKMENKAESKDRTKAIELTAELQRKNSDKVIGCEYCKKTKTWVATLYTPIETIHLHD